MKYNPPLTTHQKSTTPLHYYTIILIHHSPLTATDSRLTPLDSPLIAPLGLIEFSIQISLFSKVKFTRTDINRKKFELSILKF